MCLVLLLWMWVLSEVGLGSWWGLGSVSGSGCGSLEDVLKWVRVLALSLGDGRGGRGGLSKPKPPNYFSQKFERIFFTKLFVRTHLQINYLLLGIDPKTIFVFFLSVLGAIVAWCHRGAINIVEEQTSHSVALCSILLEKHRIP